MLLLLAALIGLLSPAVSGLFTRRFYDNPEMSAEVRRLPAGVKPTSYTLRLAVRPSEDRFEGSVQINVTFEQPTRVVKLYACRLTLFNVSVERVAETDVTYDMGMVALLLSEEVQPGESRLLQLHFEGEMREKLRDQYGGVYKESYKDGNELRWIVSLDKGFGHRMYASTVFPCFDEPALKASFEISVARPSGMTALSVMPRRATEPADEEGYEWDHFETTPPLSTYSVGFLVTNLTADPPINLYTETGNVTVQFHHRSKIRLGREWKRDIMMLHSALQYVVDYLGIPYPLPKLDIVAMPTYYWDQLSTMGLLVEREKVFPIGYTEMLPDLVDSWLIHFVSPEWWSDYYVSRYVAQFLLRETFVKTTGGASWYGFHMNRITTELTCPPNDGPHYTEDAGGSFLELMREMLSEETFRCGLRNFLLSNSYGTITASKLWSSLTERAHADGTLPQTLSVAELEASWLHGNRSIIPVLNVARDYSNNSALLRQHATVMCLNGSVAVEGDGRLWWIPIAYLTPHNMDLSGARPVRWMKERSLTINNLTDPESFVIVSPSDTGMFLVNYDSHNWRLLSRALSSSGKKFPASVRRKLLQDALLLASVGQLQHRTALDMTLFLFNETDFTVWAIFVAFLVGDCNRPFYGTPIEDKFNVYVRCLLTPVMEQSVNEYHQIANYYGRYIFRGHLYENLEAAGFQPFINFTEEYLRDYLAMFPLRDNSSQLVIFCPEFMTNDSANWRTELEGLQERISKLSPSESKFWEKSVANCPGYATLIERILNATLDELEPLTRSMWSRAIILITNDRHTRNETFRFFVQHFDQLQKRYSGRPEVWPHLVKAVISKIRTEEGLAELLAFYKANKNKLGSSRERVQTAIWEVRRAIEWNRDYLDEIDAWLSDTLATYGCYSSQ